MRRAVARGQTWWLRLLVVALVVVAGLELVPPAWGLPLLVLLVALFLTRAPRTAHPAVEVEPPVRGRWAVLNSPGSRVPSHRTRAYGQTYAVDILHPTPEGTAAVRRGLRGRRPEEFPTFGEPVVSMAGGRVIRVDDRQRDHAARDTWPALIMMLTVEGLVRELGGTRRVLGNHVVVAHDDGTFAAYAHLRRGSVSVRSGDHVEAGQRLAAVGSTGNTSEPHLHVQLMDRAHPSAAAGVPMTWRGVVTDPDDVDQRWVTGPPHSTAQAGFPPNGQIIRTAEGRTGVPQERSR